MSALCVFCGRHPVEARWRPFCSERCQLQDLARWADGTYRIPADRAAGADDSEEHDEQKDERKT
jgi:endogenous inhibitor of DNA gyrase (YacG/DUF329 family)